MKFRPEATDSVDVDKLQTRVGNLFALIPFKEGQALEFNFYPEELPKGIPYQLGSPPKHLILTYLKNNTGAQPTTGVWIDWIADAGTIRISNVTGLTAVNNYTMRVLAFA